MFCVLVLSGNSLAAKGVDPTSSMFGRAVAYLRFRALGAPFGTLQNNGGQGLNCEHRPVRILRLNAAGSHGHLPRFGRCQADVVFAWSLLLTDWRCSFFC